ncbi:MAG: AarF/ABC1/UbiB kinase family protein [Actinomycetales bacterium]|nr:AarF/ABC1/UbiB kinase family protein [Actinomycetales bacterium]
MAETPTYALARTARLASVPVSHAGRRSIVAGTKMLGGDSDLALSRAQQRTAQQLFTVLGTLKGGAMKFGQVLSVLEAALPEEFIAPYRESLTKLQDSAPPMSQKSVETQMEKGLGAKWRERFSEFDDNATAAASIGQVHKARWHDGREVAVKIQYPGAAKAVTSDLRQVARMGNLFAFAFPGIDVKSLLAELQERVSEELDYLHESKMQRKFAVAFEGHREFFVPHVLSAAKEVVVTEWVDGISLARIIESGTTEQRNRFGQLYLRFLLSGPSIAGLMHADPHPGNFRVMPDGRLAVLDFGATANLPEGLPPAMGTLLRVAMREDSQGILTGLRSEGFIRPGINLDADALRDYLAPFIEPAMTPVFKHTREWLREQFARTSDPRNPDWVIGLKINLPPSYLLIHRVWLGSIGVLCQLESEFSVLDEFVKWIPEFDSVST